MEIKRYRNDRVLSNSLNYGTANAISSIRNNIKNGFIRTITYVLKENERLDIIAGKYYGDARLWWIIAAASDIGWGLQVPPGTRITIPENLSEIDEIV